VGAEGVVRYPQGTSAPWDMLRLPSTLALSVPEEDRTIPSDALCQCPRKTGPYPRT
jgi:hypothetical protein